MFNVHQSRLSRKASFRKHSEPPLTRLSKTNVQRLPSIRMLLTSTRTVGDVDLTSKSKMRVNSTNKCQTKFRSLLTTISLASMSMSASRSQSLSIHCTMTVTVLVLSRAGKDVKKAMKAYCLSRYYEAYGLQNMLLNRF